MTDTPDPLWALVKMLRDDATISELGAQVFAGEIPRIEVGGDPARGIQPMPKRVVLLNAAGGGLIGRAFQEYGDVRVDVHCYGQTRRDAWIVHLAVRTALKQMRSQTISGVRLMWARAAGGGIVTREPDTEWPITLSSWQMLVGETVAA